MKRRHLLLIGLVYSLQQSEAFQFTHVSQIATIRGGGRSSPAKWRVHKTRNYPQDDLRASTTPKKDYRTEASGLFGNIRIPAALFAGSSAVGAFAMPLAHQETLKLGLVKRIYTLLMMTALSSQVVAVVVSTLAVALLATRPSPPTHSVSQLLYRDYALEWVTTRFHFLAGVTCFVLGVGLRAWVTIACPVIATAALGVVLSGTTLCLAFIADVERHMHTEQGNIFALPVNFWKLLAGRARQRPLFGAALLVSTVTVVYTVVKVPHIMQYLS